MRRGLRWEGRFVWDCQAWLIKRPQEKRRMTEWGREKETGREERGKGNGGERRRRTIRLLMRPFLRAYVGHGMNKQTFTNPKLMIYGQRHTARAALFYLCTRFCHLDTAFHISQLNRDPHIKTEPHCLVFISYSFSFLLIYERDPNLPSLLTTWLTHTHKI